MQRRAGQHERVASSSLPSRNFDCCESIGALGAAQQTLRLAAREQHLEGDLRAHAHAVAGQPERLHERAVEGAEAVGRVRDVGAEREPDRAPVDRLVGPEAPRQVSRLPPSRPRSASTARGARRCAARSSIFGTSSSGSRASGITIAQKRPARRPCRAGAGRRSRLWRAVLHEHAHVQQREPVGQLARDRRACRRVLTRRRRSAPRPRALVAREVAVQPLDASSASVAASSSVGTRTDGLDAHRSATCHGSQWRAG